MSGWKSAERREMLVAIDVEACSAEVAKLDITFGVLVFMTTVVFKESPLFPTIFYGFECRRT